MEEANLGILSEEPLISTEGGGSSLSHYFVNDPPSFFDELSMAVENSKANDRNSVQSKITTSVFCSVGVGNSITSNTFSGGFNIPEYIEVIGDVNEDIKVSDYVRNFWGSVECEPGVPPLLTSPGIQSPSDLCDVIQEAVIKHLGDNEITHRKVLTIDSVTQDERGLRMLISAGCYRSAVNLTGRLLTMYGQGYGRAGQYAKHSPHSLQLWFTRLALLAKLGEFEHLQTEAEPFGQLNRSDIYYEFYPEMYKGRKGSIACFSFRLLLAELPVYMNKPQVALDRLSELYVITSEIKSYFDYQKDKSAVDFWRLREMRILHSIINCSLSMKRFSLIEDVINGMILERLDLTKEERRILFSAWGRIYLQVGDIFGAEQKFAESRRLKEINSSPDLRDIIDKGLITVAKNDFQEAYIIFQKALQLESGNTMILNNMGVCLLYAGKLKEAVSLFERAIHLDPYKSLNESLLINLSTLYELQSNNSHNKKLNLLRLINKYKPDLNISIEVCLKL